jgi:hypothetical protein
MTIRRSFMLAALLLVISLALAGCGKKDQTAGGATSDSLLSANPVETPQGQIQPQTGVTPEPATQEPPAATPKPSTPARRTPAPAKPAPAAPSVTVPGGTALNITVSTALSSENAQAGQSWSGTIKDAVTVGSAAPFPAGSVVSGVVDGVRPAAKGDRAFLLLRVTSIESNGRSHSLSATGDSIVAGSTRKRNVGAIAGSAAAGALLGKAIGGSTRGAVIGGILGGAAATGAVAASKGFQVEVAQGAQMVFHVDHDTNVKL